MPKGGGDHQPMWGILTNMVSTRRSSARLQEKQSAASSAPSSPTPSAASSAAGASPSTRRARGATKASPPTATRATRRSTPPAKASPGSGAKRGRPRKNAPQTVEEENDAGSGDASATQSDTATDNGSAAEESEQPAAVTKQLFNDETTSTAPKDSESEPEQAEREDESVTTEVASEPEAEPEVVVEVPTQTEQVAEEAKPEEEEEEEIVMMDSSDEEDEEEATSVDASANQKEDEEELEDDEDFDVAAFAQMAASGINLSTAAKTSNSTGGNTLVLATKGGIHLVPDTLDSGAASRTKFLEFEGTKLALGAKVVTATVSAEEQKVLKQQLGKVEKSNRQRTEAQNVSTAGRKWFDMATHEMDADARRDFALLKMRNYLDPKKFYKTSDHTKKMPKHFQFGTVIEGAHEFKSARLTKKERKQTFTEEIMADDSIRSYTKRVFLQVQNSRAGAPGKKKKQKRF